MNNDKNDSSREINYIPATITFVSIFSFANYESLQELLPFRLNCPRQPPHVFLAKLFVCNSETKLQTSLYYLDTDGLFKSS